MSDSKSLFLSVTFWGCVLTFAAQILSRFGIQLPADTSGLANDLVSLAGICITIYGRFTATQAVHIVAPTPPSTQ